MGTVMAPAPMTPTSATFHSSWVSPMMEMRSPGWTPSAASPSATSRARLAISFQDTSCQRPSRLCFTAALPPWRAAWRSNSSTRFRAVRGSVSCGVFRAGWAMSSPRGGLALLLLHAVEQLPGAGLVAPLLRGVVGTRRHGQGLLELAAGVVRVVLLHVQLSQVDPSADVLRVLGERPEQPLLALLAVVLGPGQLVVVAPPGEVDGAVVEGRVELLGPLQAVDELPLHALHEGGDHPHGQRVVPHPGGGVEPPLHAIGFGRGGLVAQVPADLAQAALLLLGELRVVGFPVVPAREAPQHPVVLGGALLGLVELPLHLVYLPGGVAIRPERICRGEKGRHLGARRRGGRRRRRRRGWRAAGVTGRRRRLGRLRQDHRRERGTQKGPPARA